MDIFDLQLPMPSISNQLFVTSINFNILRDVRGLLHDLIEFFVGHNKFTVENEFLSKFFYKFRNQWRREKCLKHIKQVVNILEKLKKMNMIKTLDLLREMIPSRFSSLSTEDIYLPSPPVFAYTIGKLLSACIIISNANTLCILGAIELQHQIKLKVFLSYMTFGLALLASVRFQFEILKNKILDIYPKLVNCFIHLYPNQKLVIPENIKLWYNNLHVYRNVSSNNALSDLRSTHHKTETTYHSPFSTLQNNHCVGGALNTHLAPKNSSIKFKTRDGKNSKAGAKRLVAQIKYFLEENVSDIKAENSVAFVYRTKAVAPPVSISSEAPVEDERKLFSAGSRGYKSDESIVVGDATGAFNNPLSSREIRSVSSRFDSEVKLKADTQCMADIKSLSVEVNDEALDMASNPVAKDSLGRKRASAGLSKDSPSRDVSASRLQPTNDSPRRKRFASKMTPSDDSSGRDRSALELTPTKNDPSENRLASETAPTKDNRNMSAFKLTTTIDSPNRIMSATITNTTSEPDGTKPLVIGAREADVFVKKCAVRNADNVAKLLGELVGGRTGETCVGMMVCLTRLRRLARREVKGRARSNRAVRVVKAFLRDNR